jgi:hypothetical protein
MSYLDIPRLHFAGRFQADVSTVNNDVRHFSTAGFQPKYQTFGDGGWNPEGTGIFRLVGCRITGARTPWGLITAPAEDAVIGMALENADNRVFGKIVDLDPQQQMVSQIWGMRLRLTNGKERALFAGDFVPVAFTNLWRRQQSGVPTDQMLAAVYQSVLRNVTWEGSARSGVLDALRQVSEDGYLAINFNVYGYGRDPSAPRYTLGRVNGTIGPYQISEPKHFVIGRQLIPATPQTPVTPTNGVYAVQAKVLQDNKILAVNLGNALQIVDSSGALAPMGALHMAVLKTDPDALQATVAPGEIAILGTINYQQAGWYETTAGIQDFDFSADRWCVDNLSTRALALVRPRADQSFDVLLQESLSGLYVRADTFVCRMEPDSSASVELYASRYGSPLSASITLSPNTGPMGGTGAGNQTLNPPVEIPPIATPVDAVTWPDSLTTDANGKVALTIKARRLTPQYPRSYIDGQLYGIGYQLTERPAGSLERFWDFVTILVFSPFDVPAEPNWSGDIQPILRQYGNLYPIMSKHLVDLGDYDSVVKHLNILELAFSLPIDDPNHMPVTRDLSAKKREMILKWMRMPGADGLPLKGTDVTPAPTQPMAAIPEVQVVLDPLQTAGKTAFMLEFEARQKAV